jgi:DNA segregation ATPase FtsK/SpoIIIE, S-DNA-T family
VISLSWLNKFFKIFKDKEKTDNHEHAILEHDDESIKDQKGKELEARVTYHYPKGQFHFPILSVEDRIKSDGNRRRSNREDRKDKIVQVRETSQSEQHRVIRERRQSNQKNNIKELEIYEQRRPLKQQAPLEQSSPNSEQIRHKYSRATDPHIQEEQNSPIEEQARVSFPQGEIGENRTKISKKSSRPFSPTEIPSPIYGYTKRTVQSDIVEFELIDGESIVEKVTYPSINSSEKTVDIHYSDSNQMVEVKKEEGKISENAQMINKSIKEEDELFEMIPLSNEGVKEASNIEFKEVDLIVNVIEEEEKEYPSEPINLEQRDTESTDLEMEIESQNNSMSTELEEKIDIPFPICTEVIRTETDLHVPNQESERQPAQRSHLPFNVMMLKQDKRKWEQTRIDRAVQQENTPITKESETQLIESVSTEYNLLNKGYCFPTIDLLNPPMTRFAQENIEWMENQEYLLNEALKNFGVRASVVNITQGPSVTRFEVQPEPGVKVNKITNLSDDIKLSLAAKDIRIEAPIPGKHTIGIEVPNKKSRPVLISEIIRSESFQNSSSPLTAVLGLDISGAPVVTDLKKMPHGLIAGATGSGKSVCINSILISLLYKASPNELKLLLIDPKMVELAPYNHIPHLVSPVITDVKAATAALKWAVDEMERRYELFAHTGVRDINRFNEIAENHKRYSEKLPFIVIIIDELADLMMMAPADVEESICRIAQKARACGIHLIIATQRPSVDVITGLIKANVPTRTAFSVSSQIDSRTIIDISGAEKLLGRGDMLFLENGSSKPVRLQGTFVSDAEIDLVVEHVRAQQEPEYLFHQEELLKKAQIIEDEDELFYEACEFVIDQGGASTSSVQRRFKIGYNRAARLMDMMEHQGFISEPKGSKPRDVLITEEEFEQIQENTSSTFI